MTDDAGREQAFDAVLDQAGKLVAGEADPAWDEVLGRPATRGELLSMYQYMVTLHLSQAAFNLAVIEGSDDFRRDMGAKAVERIQRATEAMRKLTTAWKADL